MLSADIPVEITVTRTLAHYAVLAEALLAEGLIKESDWTGNLSKSIHAGLRRFLSDELEEGGCGGWHGGGFVPLDFAYTDNVRRSSLGSSYEDEYDADYDEVFEYGAGEKPCGGFGLVVDEWRQVIVGPAILAIERLCMGAGYSVLATVQEALAATCGCMGLFECAHMIKNWGSGSDQDETNEDTLARFHREVPEDAAAAAYSPKTVSWALEQVTVHSAKGVMDLAGLDTILHLTQSLRALVEKASAADLLSDWTEEAEMYGYPADHTLPTMIRWSEADMTPRIFDDYHESIMQSEAHTNIAFYKKCWMDDLESVRAAAKDICLTLQLIGTADRILALCHEFGHKDVSTTELPSQHWNEGCGVTRHQW